MTEHEPKPHEGEHGEEEPGDSELEFEYRVEHARSSASQCRGCRKNIDADDLRIGLNQKSTLFHGKQTFWYHFDCLFEDADDVPRSTAEVVGLDDISAEDRERVEKRIVDVTGGATPEEVHGAFKVGVAKSSRSKCRVCLKNIPMGELRVAKMQLPGEDKVFNSPVPAWCHVDCFASRKEPDWQAVSYKSFSGFQKLDDEQIELLQDKFGDAKEEEGGGTGGSATAGSGGQQAGGGGGAGSGSGGDATDGDGGESGYVSDTEGGETEALQNESPAKRQRSGG